MVFGVCLSVQINKMTIQDKLAEDPLRFLLGDKTPGSELALICQAPSEEVKLNWVTQIKSLLDMQGDFLRGQSVSHLGQRSPEG